jgi:hypothetical protein
MTMPTPAVPQRMTGRFASSILMYVRANNPDWCFDDVVDDDLVTDSLRAATYRTNAGGEHSLTTASGYSDVSLTS